MAIKVFIDTSIYEGMNFSFFNKQFSKLRELVEKESVELLYNEIVYQEVFQHIGDNLTKAISEYNKVIEENRAFAPFRMDEKWGNKISQIQMDDMISDLRCWWENYLTDTNATKIPIRDVDVDDIINKYFTKQYPFESKKPTEFKDAISIDSVKQYYDSITDEEVYVIAADKGFRRSFNKGEGIIAFSDLNKFLNFAISQSENIAAEIESSFMSGEVDDCIIKALDKQLYMGSVDIEDVYDDIDLLRIETQFVEFGYIHELDKEEALVVANARVEVEVEFTVRDEDNSYYDREDSRYYWENFVTYRATFCIDLEIDVSVVIKMNEQDLSVSVEIDDVNTDTHLYLHESDIVTSEIIHDTMDDEDEYDTDARYCPDCNCKLNYMNDMGAFCTKCAPNH